MKDFLKRLIQAESTVEKGELAVAEIISDELGRSGTDCRIDQWDANRANLVAQVKSTGRKGAILFACHLDVVPAGEASWKYPVFGGVESNGKIWGRGSADMKGGIAAVVMALREIVESGVKLEGDIVLFGAAGEETDSCGAKRFVRSFPSKLPRLAGVILPEPTGFDVVTAHRGMVWLRVTTKGKTAHGSAPHLGINAITSMKSVLDELEDYQVPFEPHKLLGGCSMSINTISGGKAVNVVPDRCSIEIDIRTVPGQNCEEIIEDFEKMFVRLRRENPQFEGEVSIVRSVGALETDSDCGFVQDFCSAVGVSETEAVGFTTDGPHFAPLGVPVVIFGPGKSEVCHKPDEYIDISDVEKAVEYYKDIILKFLC